MFLRKVKQNYKSKNCDLVEYHFNKVVHQKSNNTYFRSWIRRNVQDKEFLRDCFFEVKIETREVKIEKLKFYKVYCHKY